MMPWVQAITIATNVTSHTKQYALTRAKEAEAQRQQELLAVQVRQRDATIRIHCIAGLSCPGLIHPSTHHTNQQEALRESKSQAWAAREERLRELEEETQRAKAELEARGAAAQGEFVS
jgi:hypothetical protein